MQRSLPHRTIRRLIFLTVFFALSISPILTVSASNSATINGELRQWHPITFTFDGPQTSENATPNPFTDYRMSVLFTHIASGTSYLVPGFYAADGNAANTSATSGNKWRAYFTPSLTGNWSYDASFRTGTNIAINDQEGTSAGFFDGTSGSFTVEATNKSGRDFRWHGRLEYVTGHHLRFAGSGIYYLKNGADSPENFLGYVDFDGTSDQGGIGIPGFPNGGEFLHEYAPHIPDWNEGDPTWSADQRGKGIIGALNYLSSQGVNSIYFLTYNLDGGDGEDTWPWTTPTERLRFDVSKLDQWEIVFRHAQRLGIQLHVVTQETENDTALGTGSVSTRRALYYRELVARFGHHPVLQWNLGEENDNSDADRIRFAEYIRTLDPYDHPITVHTDNNQASFFYNGILGNQAFEASSIQGTAERYNEWAIELREETATAGRPWAIYGDEQGPLGDPVLENMSNHDAIIRDALWGNLVGGGAGVEWYFGYQGSEFGDLQTEDFRKAQQLWQASTASVNFFQTYVPFSMMAPDNSLSTTNDAQVLAKPGDVYVAFFPTGTGSGGGNLNIGNDGATFDIVWFDPINGSLASGSKATITATGIVNIGTPSAEVNRQWAALVKRQGFNGNQPPFARADSATVEPGGSIQINILANDTDEDGIDPTSAELITQPALGSAILNANGLLSYTAPASIEASTEVNFTYRVSDNTGLVSNSAEIQITISKTGVITIRPPENLEITGDLGNAPVRPTFNWTHKLSETSETVPGSYYQIYIQKNNGLFYRTWEADEDVCTGTTCAWTYPTDLNPLTDGEYTWWVGAYIDSRARYYWSNLDGEVFNVSYSNFTVDAREGRPAISFDEIPGAEWARLYVGVPGTDAVNIAWYDLTDADLGLCEAGRCTLEPAFDTSSRNNPIQVWMLTWSQANKFSSPTGTNSLASWSRLPDLNLPTDPPGDPTSIAVSNAANPVFTWQAGDNTTWFQPILVLPDQWNYNMGWQLASELGCGSNGQTCTLTDPVLNGILPAGEEYILYLRGWGPGGFTTGGTSGYTVHTFTYSPGN